MVASPSAPTTTVLDALSARRCMRRWVPPLTTGERRYYRWQPHVAGGLLTHTQCRTSRRVRHERFVILEETACVPVTWSTQSCRSGAIVYSLLSAGESSPAGRCLKIAIARGPRR